MPDQANASPAPEQENKVEIKEEVKQAPKPPAITTPEEPKPVVNTEPEPPKEKKEAKPL